MEPDAPLTPPETLSKPRLQRLCRVRRQTYQRLSRFHGRIPYLRKLPLSAILIITLLILVNLVIWAICGIVLASHTHLLSTAALAYTLGLRHALDADHISAIDLMTRRLIATGQRPVTVGTFFSLGHSTIVVVTSIVVAATAAGVSKRFDSFGNVGGIIGTSVSAAFLILLGIMNAYILYKLIMQIRKIIRLHSPEQEAAEAWKIEGGGFFFRALKKMFKLIDRPWKMYPLGVLFGLGFDTSSEIALLGISSIQGAKGTSMWLILIFPILFTSGMCLVDTIDGALMMSLYVAPMGMVGVDDKKNSNLSLGQDRDQDQDLDWEERQCEDQQQHRDREVFAATTDPQLPFDDIEGGRPDIQTVQAPRVKDPLTFLYYSIVLTTLTVICAIIIGVLQLLSLILNVASPTGKFWDGVETAGEYYEVIGGAICGSFIVFGGISVLCYKPWRRWVENERKRLRAEEDQGSELDDDPPFHGAPDVFRSTGSLNDDDYNDDDDPGAEASISRRHGDAELIEEVEGKSTVHRVAVKAYDGQDERTTTVATGSRSGGHRQP
ncbi:High-affinity nickel transport protein nic1 [Exophiala dermatitidis]